MHKSARLTHLKGNFMSNNTTADVTGIFSLDTNRLIGLAAKGSPDVTYFAGQDTPTSGIPLTLPTRGRPRLLSFGSCISQQQNSYLNTATTTSGSGDQAVGGTKVFNVANGALLAVNDKICIPLHTGRIFRTTVTAINTNAITVADTIPGLIRSQTTITKYTNNMPTLKQPLSAIGAGVAMLGGPVEMVSAYGYDGAVYQAMIGDLERDLRWYRPQYVALHLFENDLTSAGGVAGATTLTQFKAWARYSAKMCLAYGAIPIQCSPIPYYIGTAGVPASRAADWDGLRDYLCKVVADGKSQFEIDVPGAVGCNLSDGWLDPAYLNWVNWPRRPLYGWTDGVHPSSAKRFAVGAFALPALKKVLPEARSYAEDGITNLEFATLAGTGGTNDATYPFEAGSVVPTGHTTAAYGNAIATSYRNADGSLRIEATWPGEASQGGDGVIVKYSFTFPVATFGERCRFKMYARFRIHSSSGLAQVFPSIILTPTNESYIGEFGNDIAVSMPNDGSLICLTTPEFFVGVGNTTAQLSFEIRPVTGAVGAFANISLVEYGLIPVEAECPAMFV